MKILSTAYLIVICNRETNAIEKVAIWSSPEWQQSRQLDQPTYVAYELKAETFQKAIDQMCVWIGQKDSRYHYLVKYLEPNLLAKCNG